MASRNLAPDWRSNASNRAYLESLKTKSLTKEGKRLKKECAKLKRDLAESNLANDSDDDDDDTSPHTEADTGVMVTFQEKE